MRRPFLRNWKIRVVQLYSGCRRHDWVRLMTKTAEKLGFMKVRALDLYTKAEIGRKARHIKPCSRASFQQSGFETGIS